jgi:hypothetical protein
MRSGRNRKFLLLFAALFALSLFWFRWGIPEQTIQVVPVPVEASEGGVQRDHGMIHGYPIESEAPTPIPIAPQRNGPSAVDNFPPPWSDILLFIRNAPSVCPAEARDSPHLSDHDQSGKQPAKGYYLSYDPVLCQGRIHIRGYDTSGPKGKNSKPNRQGAYTMDDGLSQFVDTKLGSEWFEGLLIGPTLQHMMFERVTIEPSHGSTKALVEWVGRFYIPTANTNTSGAHQEQGATHAKYTLMIRHMYTNYEAIHELKEESDFRYVQGNSIVQYLGEDHHEGRSVLMSLPPVTLETAETLPTVGFPCTPGDPQRNGAIASVGLPMWVRKEGAAATWIDHRKSFLSGYWLPLSSKLKYDYGKYPNYDVDLLGRMNLPTYNWGSVTVRIAVPKGSSLRVSGDDPSAQSQCALRPSQVPYCGKACALDIIRNRVLYFVGDSQMRIFFYGFLSRLDISYPMNKVWRGDRTDYIPSPVNTTIKYVASYFLNLSNPTTAGAEMLADPRPAIIIAGVGQHHSCHCYSLKKHMSVVENSLELLLAAGSKNKKRRDGESNDNNNKQIIWFGVPAQPYNRHLFAPKPIGQSRKDCRNNARHLIYNAHQKHVMVQRGIPFLDAFALSVAQAHTSLDGAHYYTDVRDQYIDQLLNIIRGLP